MLYRTTPLRVLWQHPPYLHDGSAATPMDVVNHYDERFDLHPAKKQKEDLGHHVTIVCSTVTREIGRTAEVKRTDPQESGAYSREHWIW